MKSAAFVAAALALATPALATAQTAPAPAAPAPVAPTPVAPAPAATDLAAPAATAPAVPAAPAPPATPTPCGSLRGLNFICGMINVEDMLPVDGGKAIIAGSFKDASVGFYLIDTTAKTAKIVSLSVAAKPDPLYSDCPGAPDLTKLSTHGLDVREGRGGTATLYAVNHGGRESIEVFDLNARTDSAAWIGCVVAPEGASVNAVASLPDKSILFTKLLDTRTRGQGIGPVLQGQISGVVYHWVPGKGISTVPGTELSGDNGLIVSRDGKTLFVNAYGTREIWRVRLDGKEKPVSAKVQFNPDNLRWAPDGQIFVTGQFLNPAKPGGPNDWAVARLDPKNMYVKEILSAPGMKEFDNATTAIQIGNTLWLSTFKGDRIAYMNAP